MTRPSDGYVVFVEFVLEADGCEAFRGLVAENAARSVTDEPGCRRFDILTADGEPDRLALYEIYDDGAAFEDHLRTAHYHRFERESAVHVREKRVRLFALEENAK